VLFSNTPGGHAAECSLAAALDSFWLMAAAAAALPSSYTPASAGGNRTRALPGRYEVGFQWQSDNANIGPSSIADRRPVGHFTLALVVGAQHAAPSMARRCRVPSRTCLRNAALFVG